MQVGVGVDGNGLGVSAFEGGDDDLVVIEVEGDVDIGEGIFEFVEHLSFGGDPCCEVTGLGFAVSRDFEVAAGLVIEGVGREVDGVCFLRVFGLELFDEGEHGIEGSTVAVLDNEVQ